MIDVYIRDQDEIIGELFNKASTIKEVKDTIDFVKENTIYYGEYCEYNTHQIEIDDNGIRVEIIIERI